jgi:hypothetical protein
MTSDFSAVPSVRNPQLAFSRTKRDPLTQKLILFGISYGYSRDGGVGMAIYDPRGAPFKYVINGKDIDDYYVVLIAAKEPQFGIPH